VPQGHLPKRGTEFGNSLIVSAKRGIDTRKY
jgi:hypothetical protein